MEGFVAIVAIFIALPWIILHYVTKWKGAQTLSTEDENLLDELHDLARRLEDRMVTVERIIAADNPGFRSLAHEAPRDADERFYQSLRAEDRAPSRPGRSNQPGRPE